jgi:hypothetical protein
MPVNYQAHANIFRGAVAALPADMKEPLAPFEWLLDDAGNYPDIFDDGTLPETAKDAKDPGWRRFCLYPEDMAAKNMHSWPFPREQQIDHLPLLRYLFGNAVDAWQAGDIEGAIKFAGCLSHYLGDVTQPAHLLDQHLMEQLLPTPPDYPEFHYHFTVEAVVGTCPPLDAPRLLGTSIDEACWRLMEFNRRAINDCRASIVPTVQALFARDDNEAIRLASFPVQIAAEGTRDILYTVFRLASGTAARETTAPIDLRTWYPDAQSIPIAYGKAFIDHNKSSGPQNGPLHPARLRDADGVPHKVRGLGVIGRSWLQWSVPAGLFDRFEASIGMHAELATGGSGDFVVELDGEQVFRSGAMTLHDPARRISIPLGQSKLLTLKVDDPSGGLTFYFNHAIWASPELHYA